MRKVKTGDPLAIPAETFNTFIDAALDYRKRQASLSRRPQASLPQHGVVLVRNNTSGPRNRFDAVGLGDPLILPTENATAFHERVALHGLDPDPEVHAGRFALLLEPLPAGAIGTGLVSGVSTAAVDVSDASHEWATVPDGVAGPLVSALTGPARILWKEAGTGLVQAVVSLGLVPEGSAVTPHELGGSGASADTGTWNRDAPPAGTDGVTYAPLRLYWSGSVGDPVYQFLRSPTFDSRGRLSAVSAEVRSEVFPTGDCVCP